MKIGFIGAGKMATALAAGFIKAGVVPPENVVASDAKVGTNAWAGEISRSRRGRCQCESRTSGKNQSLQNHSPVYCHAITW